MTEAYKHNKRKLTAYDYKSHVVIGVLFFIYNYLYSAVNSSFMVMLYDFFDECRSLIHIRISMLPFALSLFIIAILVSKRRPKKERHASFTGIINIFCSVLILLMFRTSNPTLFLISEFILQISLGQLCVFTYNLMYKAFASMRHMGIVFSLSMTCSFLLQYMLRSTESYNLLLYTLILCCFIAAFINLSGISSRLPELENDEQARKDQKSDKEFIKIYVSLTFAIIFFEFIGNFLTDSLLSLIPTGDVIAFDLPRLFTIPAYLLMGLMAEIHDMKYIPLVTLLGVLAGILNPILFHDNSSVFANAAIYYLVAGFINAFLVLIMLKYARGRKYAVLIAVSGRIIDNISSGLFISSLLPALPLYISIAIELVCFAFVFLIFTFTGFLNPDSNKSKTTLQHISVAEFSERYGLSKKEAEIFRVALSFEGNTSELARSLYVSRSVLYRTFNNICEKTGCSSFNAVKTLYYELPFDDSFSEEESSEDRTLTERINAFCDRFGISGKEASTFVLYINNPDKTQKQIADIQGTTLRTVQRHLGSIRQKTNTSSLAQLNKLFYEERL